MKDRSVLAHLDRLCEKLLKFLADYLDSSNKGGFVIGVSGGIDSAVVATLCAQVAPAHALIMPTPSSDPASLKDALGLCASIDIPYELIDITAVLRAFSGSFVDSGIASVPHTADVSTPYSQRMRLANIAARVRMIYLFDASARLGFLVAGTSNKSERMLGYGTIYGDMACALNPIANIYKTDLYPLASYLGVGDEFLKKAPSAELWAGQSDEADIGYSYAAIDEFLRAYEAGGDLGRFDEAMRVALLGRIKNNAFKLKLPATPAF